MILAKHFLLYGTFSEGMFSRGTFSDGMFSDGTFSDMGGLVMES